MTARTSWYGKLASVGDFASRRLAPTPLEALDDWLAAGLAGWRTRDPANWLDHYLAGPSWCFAWPAGILPGFDAVGGVLMPSVDRVGRYFPLILLHPLNPSNATFDRDWLHRLSDLALDALDEDWTIEQLEAALESLDAQAPPTASPMLPTPRQLTWWRIDASGRRHQHCTPQLPEGAQFDDLIAGRVGITVPGETNE